MTWSLLTLISYVHVGTLWFPQTAWRINPYLQWRVLKWHLCHCQNLLTLRNKPETFICPAVTRPICALWFGCQNPQSPPCIKCPTLTCPSCALWFSCQNPPSPSSKPEVSNARHWRVLIVPSDSVVRTLWVHQASLKYQMPDTDVS